MSTWEVEVEIVKESQRIQFLVEDATGFDQGLVFGLQKLWGLRVWGRLQQG